MNILELRGVAVAFGGLQAVAGVDITVRRGARHAIIGPNGAGKTTVFNLVTGLYTPDAGEIIFDGEPLAGLPPHAINRRGLARTFQNIRLFPSLSVLDNVRVAAHARLGYPVAAALAHTTAATMGEARMERAARDLLKLFKLEALRDAPAQSLPYGEQRRLEIARALACRPKLLLLDEPAAGMNPAEIGQMQTLLRAVHDEYGLTTLLIEHHMQLVMGLCEQITVLDFGKVIATGTPDEIKNNPRVIAAYLGGDDDAAEGAA